MVKMRLLLLGLLSLGLGGVVGESESSSEPRYLDQFSLQFRDSDSSHSRSDRRGVKRQTETQESSSILILIYLHSLIFTIFRTFSMLKAPTTLVGGLVNVPKTTYYLLPILVGETMFKFQFSKDI